MSASPKHSALLCYRLLRAVLAGAPLLLAVTGLPAQSSFDSAAAWPSTWTRPAGCHATLSGANVTREAVYLVARMPPNTANTFTVQAELLAREVDARLRTMLGGSDSIVPDATSRVHEAAVPTELVVVARSDGSMSWHGYSASGDSSAITLLSDALDSARHHGEALMVWPEDRGADSIEFRLSLLQDGFIAARGFDSTYTGQMRFGAFALLTPTRIPALPVKGGGNIVYPHNNEFLHVTGQVIVQFIVDTTGRAEIATFHDIWPPDKPRLSGSLGRYYDSFVSAIRSHEAQAKFTPASIGGCLVPQWVRLPVAFQGPRHEGAYSTSH